MIRRRLLALLTAAAVIIALMPAIAFANGDWTASGVGENVNGIYHVRLNGGTARLQVMITGSNSSPTYKWEHEFQTAGGTEIRVIQNAAGSYVDATDTGWYCCYVGNSATGETAEVAFEVYSGDGNNQGGGGDSWDVTGNGEYRNGLYCVKLTNGKARLQVRVSGDNSSPSYKWQREIVSDGNTEYPYVGSNLPYLDVTEPGWYCCYVYKNGGDEAEVDFSVYVPEVKKGSVLTSSKNTYTVTKVASGSTAGTVAFKKAKNAKNVTVPEKVTVDGRTYKVTQIKANAFKGSKIRKVTVSKNVKSIAKNAFKGSKATKLVLKTKKLTKKSSVKGSLKGSKIRTIQVSVGKKSVNKKYVKKYKKVFTRKNAGKKVTVK